MLLLLQEAAQVTAEQVQASLNAHAAISAEFYYFVTVVVMWLIHVGFMTYETGVSRRKNLMHTVMKNLLTIAVVTVSFYFPGWWLYASLADGFVPRDASDAFTASTYPWGAYMGPNLKDHLTGVFWAAFLLFSWTTASIMSGACIERIKLGAYLVLASLLGSVIWIVDASWGWYANGWMVRAFGYHDTIASGVVHGVAGAFALGVLVNLGRRIGKYKPDGTPRAIPLHNQWATLMGLMFIFVGFWGFYAACLVIGGAGGLGATAGTAQADAWAWGTIYLDPTTLSALAFNFSMSFAGGAIGGYFISKRDPFWTLSGALAGLIANSAGATEYYPPLAFLAGVIGAVGAYGFAVLLEKTYKIDDAVGAVGVHGAGGFIGVLLVGIFIGGYPTGPNDVPVTFLGQLLGVALFFILGFVPGFTVSWLFDKFGALRIPKEVELVGQDTYVYGDQYPEFAPRKLPEPTLVGIESR